MSRPLPVRFNPFRAAEQTQSMKGTVKLAGMKRLAEVMAGEGDDAQCELSFAQPGPREYQLRLHVTAQIPLLCQRCLEVYSQGVDSETTLQLVQSEAEVEMVPEDLEPFLVEDETLDIKALVEEELLLSLPTIPRHPGDERCEVMSMHEFDASEVDDEGQGDEAKPNPFDVLGDLKDH